jgi:protein-S-isoprenylcysteine O-methyltransferase Ste14
MPELALALWVAFGGVAIVGRVLLHLRHTGSSGVHGISDASRPIEWIGGALFVGGIAVAVAGPALELADEIEPIGALDRTGIQIAGLILFALGLALTVLAQAAMGASWRIGVDPSEQTGLVTDGLFGIVRNPIYSGMVPAIAGLAILSPTALSLGGALAVAVGIEIQVRAVEEPHLLRAHGHAYAAYAARVGRFVPGLGRLSRG